MSSPAGPFYTAGDRAPAPRTSWWKFWSFPRVSGLPSSSSVNHRLHFDSLRWAERSNFFPHKRVDPCVHAQPHAKARWACWLICHPSTKEPGQQPARLVRSMNFGFKQGTLCQSARWRAIKKDILACKHMCTHTHEKRACTLRHTHEKVWCTGCPAQGT